MKNEGRGGGQPTLAVLETTGKSVFKQRNKHFYRLGRQPRGERPIRDIADNKDN